MYIVAPLPPLTTVITLMNIFYLDNAPDKCARYHADVHCSKMLIEYAQLLSTAHRETNSPLADQCYKVTHRNHPSAIWVRESTDHYSWLYDMWRSLANEFFLRRGKEHASFTKLRRVLSHNPALPTKGFTPPPQCMDDSCRTDNTIEAYRDYYVFKKNVEGKRITWTWNESSTPDWFRKREETA